MKKLILLSILLACTAYAAQERIQEPTPMRDLLILPDASEYSTDKAITSKLLMALCQEACPIIATIHTISVAGDHTKFLDSAKWKIYKDAIEEDCYLLIPVVYMKRFLRAHQGTGLSKKKQIQLLGFNYNVLTEMSPDELLGSIMRYARMSKQEMQVAGTKMLERSSNIFERMLYKSSKKILWNIYLNGHGIYPYVKGQQLSNGMPTPATLFAPKDKTPFFNLEQYDAQIAGLHLRDVQHFLRAIADKGVNSLYIASCYSGGYNSLLLYNTMLINPSSPGDEADQKREYMRARPVLPNFTIMTRSISDVISWSQADLTSCKQPRTNTQSKVTNFGAYFYLLALYRDKNIQQEGASEIATRYSDAELREIIRQVSPAVSTELAQVANFPQIIFPNAEKFVFFPLNPENEVVLSQVKVKAIQQTGGIFKIVLKSPLPTTIKPLYVFLSAFDMPITIDITRSERQEEGTLVQPPIPRFISLLPGISLQKIDKLDVSKVEATLEDVLQAFVFIAPDLAKNYYLRDVHLKTHKSGVLTNIMNASKAGKEEVSVSHIENLLIIAKANASFAFCVEAETQKAYYIIMTSDKNQGEFRLKAFKTYGLGTFIAKYPEKSPIYNVLAFLNSLTNVPVNPIQVFKDVATLEDFDIETEKKDVEAQKNWKKAEVFYV